MKEVESVSSRIYHLIIYHLTISSANIRKSSSSMAHSSQLFRKFAGK